MTSLTLKGGFSAIKFGFSRNSLEAKAWRLLYAKHVHGVSERREDGEPTVIRGYCIREMSVSKTSYLVELTLDEARRVIDSHCNCRSGSTGQCKHTGAVVLFVNSERNEAPTDRACEWNKPSNKGQALYPKGETIDSIIGNPDPMTKRKHLAPNANEKDRMIEIMKTTGLEQSLLFQVLICHPEPKGEDWLKIDDAHAREEEMPSWVSGLFANPIGRNPGLFATQSNSIVTVRSLERSLTPQALDFYHSKVKVSKDDAITICRVTILQRKSPAWHIERASRLTASVAHKVANGKKEETRVKYFTAKPPSSLRALQYGRDHEEKAREVFEHQTGLRVTNVGLCIKSNEPWLACSPDGLMQENDGSIALLEIKCPISCEKGDIVVDYIQNNSLKQQHPYFTQVQTSLYVLNLTKCYFFVFSEVDSKLFTIERDDLWL
ncbi:uncharacterized protein LOC131886483 [Tigriopus californicus]|uniref:uncharacterized protein LOC131886483 n=1 Tax=Tigriopus californicus TaxID=6832 RepID=UPI0027DA6129|nr:uncharacterized protein LOC131886483 [Tigriopus californicus]